MSIKRAILAGYGPSLKDHNFDPDVPVYAISGACKHLDLMQGLITTDCASFFPDHIGCDPMIEKHVAGFRVFRCFGLAAQSAGNHLEGEPWIGNWRKTKYKNVRWWEYSYLQQEPFIEPFAEGSNVHSLLFAVQVMDALGFDEVHFVGVDCKEQHYWPVIETLADWQRLTKTRWLNASGKDSMLVTFMEPINEIVSV